jgi:periplasmic divalent cation tolerance protein
VVTGGEASPVELEPLCVVLCNAPPERAEAIARTLVEQRLAACVNVIPGVTSIYTWKGKVEREGESTLLIKTRAARVEALTQAIRAVHPYEVPEIIALPILPGMGEPAYARWVAQETM